jgi:hypothetical protein
MRAQPYLRLRVSFPTSQGTESHRRHTGSTTIFDVVGRRLFFRWVSKGAGTRKSSSGPAHSTGGLLNVACDWS